MDDYIKNMKKKLEDTIAEEELDLLGSLIYDLIQYAIIMKNTNVIFITSIMKDVMFAYNLLIEDYDLPEEFQRNIIKKATDFLKEALPFLNKTEFSQDEIISLFNWVRTVKSETEIDMKEIRYKKEFQRKKILNFIE